MQTEEMAARLVQEVGKWIDTLAKDNAVPARYRGATDWERMLAMKARELGRRDATSESMEQLLAHLVKTLGTAYEALTVIANHHPDNPSCDALHCNGVTHAQMAEIAQAALERMGDNVSITVDSTGQAEAVVSRQDLN